MEKDFKMEWKMEENFRMEWKKEWKISLMEWRWNGKKRPEGKMENNVFHSILCPVER